MGALDTVFIDRMPTVLKDAAVHHFGTHGRTVLLLGMYVAIAILAVGIGVLARHAAGPGMAGLAAFTLIAAFVTITRPGGHVGDVAPAIIGGIAGIMALLWLLQASAPAPPLRQGRGNDRGGHSDHFDRRNSSAVAGVTAAGRSRPGWAANSARQALAPDPTAAMRAAPAPAPKAATVPSSR